MHFHDLRHTGNSLSAGTGANLRELMEHMGHSTTRAALSYLHTTSERHRKIAKPALELLVSVLPHVGPRTVMKLRGSGR